MNRTKKLIILGIFLVVIVIVLTVGVTYSFMKPITDTSSVTDVTLSSCAKISLTDKSSINLSNSYPMSKNVALNKKPYTFNITHNCSDNVGYNLYIATLSTNTLADENIRYILTKVGTKEIVKEGILGNLSDVKNTFSASEINEYNAGIKGTVQNIYLVHNEDIPVDGISYDLYLYVDENTTEGTNKSESFKAGIAVKAYDIGV